MYREVTGSNHSDGSGNLPVHSSVPGGYRCFLFAVRVPFKGPTGKNLRESLNSLPIAAQICPVLIRENKIAQISREYREIKTENVKKIRE